MLENIKKLLNIHTSKISIDEELHRYKHCDFPELEFTSVTTWLDRFKPDFQSYLVAANVSKTMRTKGILNVDTQYFVKKWSLNSKWRSIRGSAVHLFAQYYEDGNLNPEDEYEEGVVEYNDFITKEGYITLFKELIIYDANKKRAGTIDRLLYKDGTLYIHDYKTNTKYLNDYNGKLLEPFKAEYNSNYNKYSLQLSLYSNVLKSLFNDTQFIKEVFAKEYDDFTILLEEFKNIKIESAIISLGSTSNLTTPKRLHKMPISIYADLNVRVYNTKDYSQELIQYELDAHKPKRVFI